jgi:hypothetical protein
MALLLWMIALIIITVFFMSLVVDIILMIISFAYFIFKKFVVGLKNIFGL